MSHIATVDVQIKDLESLAKACTNLGLELVKGQTTYHWFGFRDYNRANYHRMLESKGVSIEAYGQGQCDHAIRVKGVHGSYEIGVIKLSDGSYTLVWDPFMGGYGLMEKVSADSDKQREGIGKLVQRYATEVASKRLRQQGYRVTESVVDGKIKLKATR